MMGATSQVEAACDPVLSLWGLFAKRVWYLISIHLNKNMLLVYPVLQGCQVSQHVFITAYCYPKRFH